MKNILHSVGKNKSIEFREYLCCCKCFSRIGRDNVKQEYNKFYSVSSHDAQRALICAMVNVEPLKRKRVKTSEKRSSTRVYKVKGIQVCKPFFLQTFRISSGKVDLALKCMKRSSGVMDCRGIGGGKKISDERFEEVIEHIEKFPKYKSHYCREQTGAQYLRADTLPVMYNIYKQESKAPVSLSKYKNIFLTHFNLKRKPLKKDTCNIIICDKLEVLQNTGSPEEGNKYREQKEEHLKLAQQARKSLMEKRQKVTKSLRSYVLT